MHRRVLLVLGEARALARREDGATAIEYGLIAALVVVALLVGLANFGAVVDALWQIVGSIQGVL